MCGILGYTHRARGLPSSVLRTAVELLHHRGPDQRGYFESEEISLGAVRLRILDLQGGDQPVYSDDGNVVLVFNGEIFNHRELRTQLQARGYNFRTTSDTEVLLKAFLEWGTGAFARMRGMFALALWIRSERKLVLARDQSGIKPLYYYPNGQEIYFGSELKVLFARPEVPRRISLDGLNFYLSLNYVPGPYTLVEGIRKLMPGEMLIWKGGQWQLQSYVAESPALPAPSTMGAACEELDELLASAVREQLVSDVPLGIWLSGGLDSSTVLHYAANAYSGPLRTFSITFKGRSFDESHYTELVSQHYGTQHTEFDLNERADLVSALNQITEHSDEPHGDAGALPLWFLARMTRKNVTVVLTGEGSDELFAGYLTYRADRYATMASHIPVPLRRAALFCAEKLPVSDEKIGMDYKLKRFLAGTLLSAEAAHVYWNEAFTEQEKAKLYWFADTRLLASLLAGFRGRDLNSCLRFDQRYYLPDDILYKVDRISMAHSLEVRPPFLDPRIVAFANRLPAAFKLRYGQAKCVLRCLMRRKLLAEVLKRPKVGFDIPVHHWFRTILRPVLLDTLSYEAVSSSGLFHAGTVQKLIREHLERKCNVGYQLWGLTVLFLWMRRWNVGLPRFEPREKERAAAASGLSLQSQQPFISSTSSVPRT